MSQHLFCSRDLGFIFEQEPYVCGRAKEILITRVKNFFMHNIKEAFHAAEEIKPERAVVFGTADSASGGEQAVLLSESTMAPDEVSLIREKVRKAVFDRRDLTLGVIESFAVGEILKTTSGKVRRHQDKIKVQTWSPETIVMTTNLQKRIEARIEALIWPSARFRPPRTCADNARL